VCGTAAYCIFFRIPDPAIYFYLIDIDFLCVRTQVYEEIIGGRYVCTSRRVTL
jgi:hypothetical protein